MSSVLDGQRGGVRVRAVERPTPQRRPDTTEEPGTDRVGGTSRRGRSA